MWGNFEAVGKGASEAGSLGARRRSGAAAGGVNQGFPPQKIR